MLYILSSQNERLLAKLYLNIILLPKCAISNLNRKLNAYSMTANKSKWCNYIYFHFKKKKEKQKPFSGL